MSGMNDNAGVADTFTVEKFAPVREPRVWFDGDVVPAGVWVYILHEEEPEDAVYLFDAGEPCRNCGLGPLVEVFVPSRDELDAIVTRAAAARHGTTGGAVTPAGDVGLTVTKSGEPGDG